MCDVKSVICDTMGIRKSDFCSVLLGLNETHGCKFAQWVFYPGMLFHSEDKWWGDWGVRKRAHEGLDLCFYRGTDGVIRSLDAGADIPVMYDGTVIRLVDDYIGQTVFVLHEIYDTNQKQLCTIYGHTVPCSAIDYLTPLKEGDTIAAICDADSKGAHMASHLHLSVAWVPKSYQHRQMNWDSLTHHTEIVLLDPLDFIKCSYTILPAG